MNELDFLLAAIASQFGLNPASLVLLIGTIVSVSQLIGKLILDDATGWLATVRKVAKVLGLYVSNRVSAGISVGDVAASVLENGQTRRPASIFQPTDSEK